MKHCQVEVQEKYFWTSFSKENLVIMIFNTLQMLFIMSSNMYFEKMFFFSPVRIFTLIYGPFSCLTNVLFSLILMSSKLSEQLKKQQKKIIVSSFCKLQLKHNFFCTFTLTFKNHLISWIFTKFMWWKPFLKISITVIKVVKNQI